LLTSAGGSTSLEVTTMTSMDTRIAQQEQPSVAAAGIAADDRLSPTMRFSRWWLGELDHLYQHQIEINRAIFDAALQHARTMQDDNLHLLSLSKAADILTGAWRSDASRATALFADAGQSSRDRKKEASTVPERTRAPALGDNQAA